MICLAWKNLTWLLDLVKLELAGMVPADWIDRLTELEFIISAIDNRAEFASYDYDPELAGLDEFDLVPVEFEEYGEDN